MTDLSREQIEYWRDRLTPDAIKQNASLAIHDLCDMALAKKDVEAECERLRGALGKFYGLSNDLSCRRDPKGLLEACVDAQKALATLGEPSTAQIVEAQQWPIGADAPHPPQQARVELVGQVYELIDQIERTLHLFGDDDEGRSQATGVIDHARRVASPYNYNGGAPEQAHGDALAAAEESLRFLEGDGYRVSPRLVRHHHDIIRQALTASGVPHVPEGLGYADITSPEYNGWINLLWGSDKFPVGMVPPPYSTQIKRALASAPADGCKLVPVEPTEEMLDVTVVDAGDPSAVSGVRQRHREVYRAMIAAAPQRGGE